MCLGDQVDARFADAESRPHVFRHIQRVRLPATSLTYAVDGVVGVSAALSSWSAVPGSIALFRGPTDTRQADQRSRRRRP